MVITCSRRERTGADDADVGQAFCIEIGNGMVHPSADTSEDDYVLRANGRCRMMRMIYFALLSFPKKSLSFFTSLAVSIARANTDLKIF